MGKYANVSWLEITLADMRGKSDTGGGATPVAPPRIVRGSLAEIEHERRIGYNYEAYFRSLMLRLAALKVDFTE